MRCVDREAGRFRVYWERDEIGQFVMLADLSLQPVQELYFFGFIQLIIKAMSNIKWSAHMIISSRSVRGTSNSLPAPASVRN